jgi:hypothetical protein
MREMADSKNTVIGFGGLNWFFDVPITMHEDPP